MKKLNLRRGDSTIFFGAPEVPDIDTDPLFLIHGYNVANAQKAYDEIAKRMQKYYTDVVGVWWPGSEFAWAFWMARMRARKAGRLLAPYLRGDVEAHSLGCMVALEALLAGAKVRNLILAAAAVDNESILRGKRYGAALKNAERVLIARNMHDPVLRTAYRFARLDNALGLTGPENYIDLPEHVEVLDLTGGHSSYRHSDEFYKMWEWMLK